MNYLTRARAWAGELINTGENRVMIAAVACSLLLHVAIAAVVLRGRIVPAETVAADIVQIQLLPAPPQSPPVQPEPEPAPVIEPEPAVVEQIAPELIAPEPVEPEATLAESEPPQPVEEQLPEPVPEAVVEISSDTLPPTAPEPIENIRRPLLTLPSVQAVQQSLQKIEESDRMRLWAYDCNRQQEESELITCNDEATPDLRALQTNPTYQALNPVRELSRGLRSLPTVTTNAPALAGRLQSSDIPAGLGEYLMQEVEAGITHNTNVGNRAVNHMGAMTDKSAAGAMAREILGDPWIVNQAKEIQQRRVHDQ